ncbi:MAG: glutaredoxin 3 [Halopseudomonas yangmingensis]|uniref:Glutaredoxin n=1 Tax=Halopseudomonas yangmingensis TaxID=1720063 RepID=A0A1I4PEX5_9GAMM|nr:glutaredoxin 3 [Halopseudomonas yangmingensis]SFM26299.1 glutaredoxin 3 [Halopseudomonas yangmingensis]
MADIIIYSSNYCPFCSRAKHLLDSKGLSYREIGVDGQPAVRAEMTRLAGRTSVPQIWINGTHVGGCDELLALDRTGKLDTLLAG